jgi:hypothetical protein
VDEGVLIDFVVTLTKSQQYDDSGNFTPDRWSALQKGYKKRE